MAGLVLKLTLDKTEAQKALSDFSREVAVTLSKSIPKATGSPAGTTGGSLPGGSSVGGGAPASSGGASAGKQGDPVSTLESLSKAMDEASKSFEVGEKKQASLQKQMADTSKYEAVRGWFSDLRDIFDISTQSLLGFTDVQAQAASQAAYLAEKGLTLGLAFGPIGAILGGASGIILSMVHYVIQSQKEIDKLSKETNEAAEEFRSLMNAFYDFDKFDSAGTVRAIVKEFDALQKKTEEESSGLLDYLQSHKILWQEIKNQLGGQKNATLENIDLQDRLQEAITETQKSILSSQVQTWYFTAAKEARGFVEEIDKAISNSKKLGQEKSIKELAEESKDAEEKLSKLREEADQLYINLSVLRLNAKENRIITEQDKKDLEEAQTLFDAASSSIEEWFRTFTTAKSAENAARKKSAEEAKRIREEEYIESVKDFERMKKREEARTLKLVEENAKRLTDQYNFVLEQQQLDLRFLNFENEFQKQITETQRVAQEEREEHARKHQENLTAEYEKVFGYAANFLGNFTAAIEENISAEERAFKNFGLVAKQAVADVLKSLGKEWAAKAIAQFAQGFAFLAVGNPASAGASFASGAAYGVAAAAAGVGGAVISGRTTAESNRRSNEEQQREERRRGGSGNGVSSGFGNGGRGEAGTVGTSIILNMNGNIFPTTNERDAASFGASLVSALAAAQRGGFDTMGGMR